jgi:hypothetical protein
MQNKTIGIYLITERATGKMYVGLSGARGGIEGRWVGHKKRFPEEHFTYEILLPCPAGTTRAELSNLEKFYVRELDCMEPKGFNRTSGGCGKTEKSEASKKRTSETMKGRPANNKGMPLSKKSREKIKIASTGRKHSEETKKKLSVSKTGKKLSEEHKKKSATALKKARKIPRSEEARANMSAAQKASWVGRVISEETSKKLASGRKGKVGPNKGKKFSEEHRKNIAEANRRKAPKSEETRKKQSESLKARLALKRAAKAAAIAALEALLAPEIISIPE